LGRDNNHVVEWNFKARKEREKEIRTHHNPDLGEVIAFPLIIFFVICHGGYTQMAFSRDSQVGSFEILKIGTSTTLDAHNFL